MNKTDYHQHRAELFEERTRVTKTAQEEYAHGQSDAFDNFNRIGNVVRVPCEHCGKATRIGRLGAWAVYFLKHIDGVLAFIGGNNSQREDVRGRLTDIVNYADLADGMIVESRNGIADRPLSPEKERIMTDSTIYDAVIEQRRMNEEARQKKDETHPIPRPTYMKPGHAAPYGESDNV